MVAAAALHPAGGERGISWPGTARHSLLERQYYHRQVGNGTAQGTWLVESVQEIAAQQEPGPGTGSFLRGRPLSLAAGDASRQDAHDGPNYGCPMILAASARVLRGGGANAWA